MPVPPVQVQVVDNRADVKGTIREIRAHGELPNHSTIVVDVDSVAPVDRYPNLIAPAKTPSMEITVANDELARRNLAAGQQVTLRVKKAGPGAVFMVPQ